MTGDAAAGKPAQPDPGPVAKGCGCLVLLVIVALPVWLGIRFLGGDDGEDVARQPVASAAPSSTQSPSPSQSPSQSPSPSPSPTAEPPPPPPPPVDSMGSRDDAEKYFDDVVLGDIEWSDRPSTDPPTERLLGQNTEDGQIIELLGPPPAALNEISCSVVMNGTSVQLNERALIPMVQAAIKYASDDAGQFIGAELDEISRQDSVPAKQASKTFGKR